MSVAKQQKTVTLLGAGQMGKKMAEMYIGKGYRVIVWNRNIEKASAIRGAQVASTPEEAIRESDIIIVCVLDNTAVTAILDQVNNETLKGKTLINLTTGSTEEVKLLEARLRAAGAGYLNGAIQVAPEQMGQPDTTILLAGDSSQYELAKEELDILGGNIKFLGNKASASPAMDLATLSWVYGSYFGLLYGAALVQNEGMELTDYKNIVGEIAPSFVEFFKHEINELNTGNFNITQSPLVISIGATQRIADAAKAAGLDAQFTNTMASLLKEAGNRGYDKEELTALIKVISQPRS